MGNLSKNFSKEEFACNCGNCKQIGPDPLLVEELQKIRDHFKAPIHINSGYRCPAYNKKIGGAKFSQHMLGTAADFTVEGKTPFDVQSYLWTAYPHSYGIGRYQNFTHFDVRDKRARWGNP